MPDQRRRPLRLPGPDIVRRQVVLEEQDLAPDGSFAVASRRFVTGNDYASHLYLVPVGAPRKRGMPVPRQLTRGAVRDKRPAVSPDGRYVAFTRRALGEDDASLFVLDLEGGEPDRRTTGVPVREITWSPDGRWIAFVGDTGAERLIVGPTPAGEAPMARHIRHLDWRYDEEGYLDRRSELHVVAAKGSARPQRLTTGMFDVSGLAWRPDGDAIAYVADPREEAHRHPRSSVWEVAFGGRRRTPERGSARVHSPERHEILALAGPVHSPAYSPDGRWIAAVGVDDADHFDDHSPTLFVGPADGSAPAVALAPDLDRPIGNWADTDLTGWKAEPRRGPVWAAPETIVALVSDRGRTHPWRFPVDPATGRAAGDPVRLAGGDVMADSLAAGGGRVAVTATIGARPPELAVMTDGGELRPVTRLGSSWTDGLAWPEMRVVEAPGPGGPIETWIASPAGAGAVALPTIVDVLGGPLGAWAPAPSIEVVLLCARGYRVVLPNIRGSATYGADWIRPQLGDWGGVDADDVHAVLDHVIGLGMADPEQLGVLGLSYGGFMANWLVGTTDRFRAAVSENGVTNQVSAWSQCDEGPEYCRSARMGDPTTPEGVERLWRQSPLRNVAAVTTPLLMLQAEADRRCPPADNEQYFVTLRWLGRDVEYVLYPDEYHVFQATGRPDRRIDRMTRLLDWFDRHIPR